MRDTFDMVIVGAGIAGLACLLACPPGLRVGVVSPGNPLSSGSSWRAQGGVAVALSLGDSAKKHAADTMAAARSLAENLAVEVLTQEGILRIQDLLKEGIDFDRSPEGNLEFGLEAAHSHPRVLHQQDRTGAQIMNHLWSKSRDRAATTFIDDRASALLLYDSGICGLTLERGAPLRVARVVLATGGFAGLYWSTTTGKDVRGDGLILAARAGAELRDLEFVQFHPTALDLETNTGAPLPLLTEALRGAGAQLLDASGQRFVEELAPRDEVARAIALRRGFGSVYLDLSPVRNLEQRFPGAHMLLSKVGTREGWLPVRPAAHFTIGGVKTNLDGETGVPGLYACGEVASVGVHGANRLASNSLLEGLVFGHRTALRAADDWRKPSPFRVESQPLVRLQGCGLKELQQRFEQAVGVVREASSLEDFLEWSQGQLPSTELELSVRVAQAALARSQSLGAHYRRDALLTTI